MTTQDGGQPADDVVVTCAPAKREGPSTVYALSTEEYMDSFRDGSQRTDSDGKAVFVIGVFTLRGGILVWLGIDRLKLEDEITGADYLFRIEGGGHEELLAVQMAPNARDEGEYYSVMVGSIGPPSQ